MGHLRIVAGLGVVLHIAGLAARRIGLVEVAGRSRLAVAAVVGRPAKRDVRLLLPLLLQLAKRAHWF